MKEELPTMRQALTDLQGMMKQLLYTRGNEGVEGQAEHWFGTYIKAKGRVQWKEFVNNVNSRFARLFKESVIGEFHKLKQLGTVEQYYNEFETIRSVLVNEGCKFEEDYYVQSFVSGLRDEIRLEIEKFELYDLSRTIYLARKREAALSRSWHQPRLNTKSNLHSPYTPPTSSKTLPSPTPVKPKSSFIIPAVTSFQLPVQNQNQSKALLPTPNNPPYQKFNKEYFDDMRRKGLCYWCEKTFTPAHNCKHKQVSILIVDEGDEEDTPPVYDEEVQDPKDKQLDAPTEENQEGMIWERAVEIALDGQTDVASVRTLTLDRAVKCVHGRLPPPALLEKFNNLQHLSVANIGISSLEQFPHLQNLQKLILSDNRIVGGLEYLVEADLESLRDLDFDGIVDVDEDEESDADEEETETLRSAIVASPLEWFRVAAVDVEEDEEDEGEEDEDNDLVEEIDEDDGDDEDVVEVHEIDVITLWYSRRREADIQEVDELGGD
ncbi:hypothetical protein RJ640_029560 [Escallonia rubra]|uniref:Retrotransposon gag domain-containing protein n=1 Tax=Escallonia rubra TaxID=112253 RepID=A0AA88RPG7_9ASTE|nr:hypothetical protein RJ640_029560 [Escallonia rubra]